MRWLLECSNDRRTWIVVDVFDDEADILEAIANTRALWFQVSPVETTVVLP